MRFFDCAQNDNITLKITSSKITIPSSPLFFQRLSKPCFEVMAKPRKSSVGEKSSLELAN